MTHDELVKQLEDLHALIAALLIKVKASKPHCVVSTQAQSLVNAYTYTETASALTIAQVGSGGTVWDYICMISN